MESSQLRDEVFVSLDGFAGAGDSAVAYSISTILQLKN